MRISSTAYFVLRLLLCMLFATAYAANPEDSLSVEALQPPSDISGLRYLNAMQGLAVGALVSAALLAHPYPVKSGLGDTILKFRFFGIWAVHSIAIGIQHGQVGKGKDKLRAEQLEVVLDGGRKKPDGCVDADIGGMGIVIPSTLFVVFVGLQVIFGIANKGEKCCGNSVKIAMASLLLAFSLSILGQIIMKRLSFADAVTSLIFLDGLSIITKVSLALSLALKQQLKEAVSTTYTIIAIIFANICSLIIGGLMSRFDYLNPAPSEVVYEKMNFVVEECHQYGYPSWADPIWKRYSTIWMLPCLMVLSLTQMGGLVKGSCCRKREQERKRREGLIAQILQAMN